LTPITGLFEWSKQMAKFQKDPTARRVAELLAGASNIVIDSGDAQLDRAAAAAVERVKAALVTARDEFEDSHGTDFEALESAGRHIGKILRGLNGSGIYVTAETVTSLSDAESSDRGSTQPSIPRLRLRVFRLVSAAA
jgi:hypothetical protein